MEKEYLKKSCEGASFFLVHHDYEMVRILNFLLSLETHGQDYLFFKKYIVDSY